jgi:ribosomal protein L11 methyltransferase
MEWLAIKVILNKEYLEEVAEVFNDLGSGGAVIDDPDLVEEYAQSGQWDAWEFPEIPGGKKYSVTGYLPVNHELEGRLENLFQKLNELKNTKENFSFEVDQTPVDEEDWANSWKQYFKVLKIGEKTIIRPSWEEYHQNPGEIVIDLDPGMAFGTGSHATTSQAMELTEKYLKTGDKVIDVGTGSGIISIQAAKLGASFVNAYDYDAVAVKSAERNVEDNNLSSIISVKQNDLLNGVEEKADLIIANIVADVIIRLIPQLDSHLLEGGKIVLSGIIEKRIEDIKELLNEYNFEIFESREKEGWFALGVKRVKE